MWSAKAIAMLMQVKELTAKVLPVDLAALSAEPARPSAAPLPPVETHQVRTGIIHRLASDDIAELLAG